MVGVACNKLRNVKIAVARETREGEARVAMVPELVGKLTGLGYEVLVEPGAGRSAEFADDEYAGEGATISDAALSEADVVVAVQPLDTAAVGRLRKGAATISFLPVNSEQDLVVTLRDAGVTAFAM
jgi:NAD(P) transhydrogenase subunit alpha